MNKLNITGKQLRTIGYPEGPVISIAMQTINTHYKHTLVVDAFAILTNILAKPEDYLQHEILHTIAKQLVVQVEVEKITIPLLATGIPYQIYGAEHIEAGALAQMEIASKLPVAVAGALMPDAHQGYGLPIGGVLATNNAIIPYAVGVDIGCRMCLSVFAIPAAELKSKVEYYQKVLVSHTLFGTGKDFTSRQLRHLKTEAAVLDSPLFNEISMLKPLQQKAANQLGSSGSGNHFVEFGEVQITEQDAIWNVPPGNYVGLLSHSGSRGLGATIANHYTKLATSITVLPQEAKHLAWLNMDTQEGMEYWLAMNLAGDYASACHHAIHKHIATALCMQPISMVENHHNFAWKEMLHGQEVIVHRKGATPASKNVLGIIPGSMTAAGYIVKGKGNTVALQSASHGAGRAMSRTKALANITKPMLANTLAEHGVTLIGAGLDEAPMAYKDIETVLQSQTELVNVIGKFVPKIVQMDGGDVSRQRVSYRKN